MDRALEDGGYRGHEYGDSLLLWRACARAGTRGRAVAREVAFESALAGPAH
jgi:hypothetical protein